MLLIPEHLQKKDLVVRDELVKHFNKEMELVIDNNKDKDKFWILGKIKFPHGTKVGRVFLDACDEKPILVKGSFVYEIDNRKGTKELLWTCDNDKLNVIPTGKSFKI